MLDHKGKFALTYEGPFMVKRAFFKGAFILANIKILMLSYSTLHEGASKCNLFFYIPM